MIFQTSTSYRPPCFSYFPVNIQPKIQRLMKFEHHPILTIYKMIICLVKSYNNNIVVGMWTKIVLKIYIQSVSRGFNIFYTLIIYKKISKHRNIYDTYIIPWYYHYYRLLSFLDLYIMTIWYRHTFQKERESVCVCERKETIYVFDNRFIAHEFVIVRWKKIKHNNREWRRSWRVLKAIGIIIIIFINE